MVKAASLSKNRKLNIQQEQFCVLYTSWDKEFYGNWMQSYAEAYKIDKTKKDRYKQAKANAHRLITTDYIIDRINELLEEDGLNDVNVDKQLLYLVNQHEDKNVKVAAIKEYNKLKQRITEKVEHSWNITVNNILNDIIQ